MQKSTAQRAQHARQPAEFAKIEFWERDDGQEVEPEDEFWSSILHTKSYAQRNKYEEKIGIAARSEHSQ